MSDPSQDAYRQALSRGEGTPLPRDEEPKVASINPDGSIEVSKGGKPLATIRPATAENLGVATLEAPLAPVAADEKVQKDAYDAAFERGPSSAREDAAAQKAHAVFLEDLGISGAEISINANRTYVALSGYVDGLWQTTSILVDVNGRTNEVERVRPKLMQWMKDIGWQK